MQKKERHDFILKLIGTEKISRQDLLAEKLGQGGFVVTQASVSRDLEELGISKNNGIYELPSAASGAVRYGLKSLSPVGANLIVGSCDPGLASAITVRIDAAGIDEIVGTIAGDDTIFIAVPDIDKQAAAIAKIWNLFSD
ncbi:MAG: arginine repressor [Chloracidobacterium sp.]|nr:arginine repressor [Chloracidobacterium sp.]